ncbi:class I SAM-dependent methyltransferase [Sphingomonas sp. Tas61C01]|uniref:class I SAM-dependent methyltransferase n=1 Tax=Sphingomonas sp. Tas61C01 TaxID=3458297 RepID=UPI00403E7493
MAEAVTSPDLHAIGFLKERVDPLRYSGHTEEPMEVGSILRSMMPSGVRVLDVGCGTGSVTAIANRAKGNDVVGVEPDEDRAGIVRSRGIAVRVGELDGDMQRELGLFDVVMSSDVLEHVAASQTFLALLKASLRPGGMLLLSVPNVAHWSVRAMILSGRFDYEDVGIMDATHLRWFTAKSLRALLDGCGFDVVEMRQTAGSTLPIYQRGLLGKIPGRVRRPAVRAGTRLLPLMFGVQHVVKAVARN